MIAFAPGTSSIFSPAPPTSYGAVDTAAPRARVVTPPYAGASQRIVGPRKAQSRKPPCFRMQAGSTAGYDRGPQ